jgi:hypothetical protein
MGVFFILTMALLRGINGVGEVLDYNTLVFAVGCRERKRNTGGNFDSLWCPRSDGVRVIREMRTVEG